ncbi:MAG: RNA-binding S4 domain-containing protein [Deltaproteobacteria bacterium]|nr:RNA-binding S4 domain-containing protein [Deltaproteobacteria bacterium]
MDEFKIHGEYIELVKLLKAAAWCDTGGMAKLAVSDGLVKVDGQVELRKGRKIKKGQIVTFQQYSVHIV